MRPVANGFTTVPLGAAAYLLVVEGAVYHG